MDNGILKSRRLRLEALGLVMEGLEVKEVVECLGFSLAATLAQVSDDIDWDELLISLKKVYTLVKKSTENLNG